MCFSPRALWAASLRSEYAKERGWFAYLAYAQIAALVASLVITVFGTLQTAWTL